MSIMAALARQYATAHPEAAAERLENLASDEAGAFLARLEPETASAVVAQMWPRSAAATLQNVAPDHVARIMESLNLSTAVALLRLLPTAARADILGALPRSLESRVWKALSLPAGSAGSAADSAITPHNADTTAAEALSRGTDPRVPYVYVVDHDYRLVGVIHRTELENAKEGTSLRSIMRTPVQKLPASTPLEVLHRHAAWSNFDALPVVDPHDAFLGIIRHKALRAAPRMAKDRPGTTTTLTTLLDLGEVYWSGLYSAIEAFAEDGGPKVQGGSQ